MSFSSTATAYNARYSSPWTYPYPWLLHYPQGPTRCTYSPASMHPEPGETNCQLQIQQQSGQPFPFFMEHSHPSLGRAGPPAAGPSGAPPASPLLPPLDYPGCKLSRGPCDIPVPLATLYDPSVGVPLYIGRESDGWLVHSYHWDFADYVDFHDPPQAVIDGRWRVHDPHFAHPGLAPLHCTATAGGWRLAHWQGSDYWAQERPSPYVFPPCIADGETQTLQQHQAVDPVGLFSTGPVTASRHRRYDGSARVGIGLPRWKPRFWPAGDSPGPSVETAAASGPAQPSRQIDTTHSQAGPSSPRLVSSNANMPDPAKPSAAPRTKVLSPLAAPFQPKAFQLGGYTFRSAISSRAVDPTWGQLGSVSGSSSRRAQPPQLQPCAGPEVAVCQSSSSSRQQNAVDQHVSSALTEHAFSPSRRKIRGKRGALARRAGSHLPQASLSALAECLAISRRPTRVLVRSVSEPIRGQIQDSSLSAMASLPHPPEHTPQGSAGEDASKLSTEIAHVSKPDATRRSTSSIGRSPRRAVTSPAGAYDPSRVTDLWLGNGI